MTKCKNVKIKSKRKQNWEGKEGCHGTRRAEQKGAERTAKQKKFREKKKATVTQDEQQKEGQKISKNRSISPFT